MLKTLVVMVIIAVGLLVAPYQIARRSAHPAPPQQDDHDTHEQQ